MDSVQSDLYWSATQDDHDATGLGHLRGYSPAPHLSYRTGSTDSLPTLGRLSSGLLQQSGTQQQPSNQQSIQHPQSSTYGLSPSALDPNSFSSQFILPRFASAGAGDAFGYPGVGLAQAGNMHDTMKSTGFAISPVGTPSSLYQSMYGNGNGNMQIRPQQQEGPNQQNGQDHHSRPSLPTHSNNSGSSVASTSSAPYPGDQTGSMYAPYGSGVSSGPIYAPYGSSIISVQPQGAGGYKMPPLAISLPPSNPTPSSYDPQALGLPVPPPTGMNNNFAGLYSSSGFDMLGVLARVAARPNPQLQIGAVDTSCAFLVVDARKWDQPIVFASDTFTKMTGYKSEDIIGRNCRFLQSPDGITQQGAARKYTDSNAAWHMRTHIAAGKESQSSLINYKKDGKPFINLVTIVPIAWDSDEIAYFVGFQVDLVDQPNAILDRMKDGTYVINYTLTAQTARAATTVSMQSIENEANEANDANEDTTMWEADDKLAPLPKQTTSRSAGTAQSSVLAQMGGAPDGSKLTEEEALDIVTSVGADGLQTEADKRVFHKMILSETDDFVHVLSLKGSFLYCSPSCARVLEYQPNELIGKTLPTLCHPSDVVPVMRLLKDTSSIQNPTVELLYRVRRKHSGYVWLGASGRLHIEPGKGRKCVIFVGRPREVLKMSWNDLRSAGGLGDTEFWMHLSPKGNVLSTTSSVQTVLGVMPDDIVGSTLLSLAMPEYAAAIEQALTQCVGGTASSVRYRLRDLSGVKDKRGYIDVVTRFYPRNVDEADNLTPPPHAGPCPINIVAQTNEISSNQRKVQSVFASQAPTYPTTAGRSPSAESDSTASGSASSKSTAFQSTFKTLTHPSAMNDNVFDELESRRPTSWQFELHQLQNMNRKLREEKDHVLSISRRHGLVNPFDPASLSSRKKKGSSDSSSRTSKSNKGRGCANCGKMDSPEWRAGPTGLKTLCNACGLRWAKTQRQSSEAAASAASGSSRGVGGGGPSPSSASASALSPFPSDMTGDASWLTQ